MTNHTDNPLADRLYGFALLLDERRAYGGNSVVLGKASARDLQVALEDAAAALRSEEPTRRDFSQPCELCGADRWHDGSCPRCIASTNPNIWEEVARWLESMSDQMVHSDHLTLRAAAALLRSTGKREVSAQCAIAAAQDVIGQCDCIMAEGPQDDPKRAWREARDAYRKLMAPRG